MKSDSKYLYLFSFILPALVVIGAYLGGWWNYLNVIFVFGFLTVTDHLIGLNTTNVDADRLSEVSDDYFYRLVTFCWTYVQLAFIFWASYIVSIGQIQSVGEWIGFVLSSSLVTGGIGITVAHELGHKSSKIERLYSKLLLMTVCYMHFHIEHNKGHHVHVATPADPATARKHEWFYSFWIRCVTGGYLHAWTIENESFRRKGVSPMSIKNAMIWFSLLPVIFCAILTLSFTLLNNELAWQVPLFFFSQSILAFTMLELVNYVEHYGIVRKLQSDGRYERVNPLHSWNASHRLSNYFLFQLQRHSDHHFNAIKRYQVLNHFDESPQLPYGYPTMILIALVPPLWFNIVDPLLEEWKKKVYIPVQTAA